MKVNIYSIHDIKTEAFMQPFFARSHGEAIRMVENAVEDPQSGFHKHAQDYRLFFIGIFEDGPGEITGHQAVHIQDLSAFTNTTKPTINHSLDEQLNLSNPDALKGK